MTHPNAVPMPTPGLPVQPIDWFNSIDGSVSGLVIGTRTDGSKYAVIGSRMAASSEELDAIHISNWGTKITADQFRKWADELESE